MRDFVGRGEFTWFFGVVEDRNDPAKLGRVRVRAYGFHNESKDEIPTNSLPWAITLNSNDSASVSGLGRSPTGIVEGTWVVGFFMDGERAQEPAIMGTLIGAPSATAETTLGFNDPLGVYPKYIDESDVNKRARGVANTVTEDAGKINIPVSPYAPVYPLNHVRETESGHYKEYDDTPDAERIKEFHKSGTMYEVYPDGDKVTRVVKDNYSLVLGNDSLHVKGNVSIFVDGDAAVNVVGNTAIDVGGDTTVSVVGNTDIDVGGDTTVTVAGDTSLTVSGTTTVDTPNTNWTGNINL